MDRFETPEKVLAASARELATVPGMSGEIASAIAACRVTDAMKREVDLARSAGVGFLTLADTGYPLLLKELPDPPPLLYVRGALSGDAECIAVVGSRSATAYGRNAAESLSRDLSAMGFTVVSGMARGIDTAAHRGALDAAGRTVAVLGSGLGRIYPPENGALAERIAENGAVVSEFPMAAEPLPRHFPMRNRIISGLSRGTLVVEAGRTSGSLITARLALEQGREAFAVPGRIRSFKSTGTHSLLKQGAKLVECAKDVADELAFVLNSPSLKGVEMQDGGTEGGKTPPLDPEETAVFRALGPYPVHIDEIVRKLSMDPGRLSGILLGLELKGLVTQSPGKLFSISEERL